MSGVADEALLAQVRTWIQDDPDPDDAAELRRLLAEAGEGPAEASRAQVALAELQDRFSGMLQFGTAGLRGELGAGPNRMNRAVVIRAAAGLMAYLNEYLGSGARVVIGYDARHRSSRFAADTADVVAAAGGEALVLPGPCPTPVLAFAVRHLGADAGVMVTASHNPPQDNGYKVYLGGRVETDEGAGVQIVPPADAQIAAHIAAVPSAGAVARTAADAERAGGRIHHLGADLTEAYITRAVSTVPAGPRQLRVVLTPLHGVGGPIVTEVLARAGFTDVHVVPEQADPDPQFPTVAFPNPEEPGALDLAMRTASEVGADLIIANDPDADRCSIAIPDGDTGWRQLSGDEVGALLGEQIAAAAAHQPDAALASSVVSSQILAPIAKAHGLTHVTTLTGFKWISRVPGLVFGYEEAIGYCVDPEAVRDKDGITAAAHLAALAARLHAEGSTMARALDDIARAYGLHATAPLSVRVDDPAVITAAMRVLREEPPSSLGNSPVTEVIDLAADSEHLPPTDAVLFRTAEGDRVIVRPSGTEPKVKCYLEVVRPVDGEDVGPVRARAEERLARLSADIGQYLTPR